jgi:hypothetical protein
MSRIVEFRLSESQPHLTVRDRELLLEVLDGAIDETLSAAVVFSRDSEARYGYNERINTLLRLFQKLIGDEDSTFLVRALSTSETYR